MSPETIDRIISATTTTVLVGLGVLAYYLGALELGAVIVGGALGHATPARKQRAAS